MFYPADAADVLCGVAIEDKKESALMTEIEQFLEIIKVLRSENGCPWDREQTNSSLKAACIEEAAEVVCGIDIYEQTGNAENLLEELGDLLLIIAMHAQIASENGLFDFEDVARVIKEKMIRRHPHVFSGETADDSDAVLKRWEEIKAQEKAGKEWMNAWLPAALEESKALIDKAKERKGFV